MKGLLLKDFFVMLYRCKGYLFVTAATLFSSFLDDDPISSLIFFPCLVCGMIPISLLGYDERSGFLQYSAALPYSRKDIVSAKYLLSLFLTFTVLVLTVIVQVLRMWLRVGFVPGWFKQPILSAFLASTLTPAITLPFIFRYGIERGRIAYYVMIGFVCIGTMLVSGFVNGDILLRLSSGAVLAALAVAGGGIYALSWHLSVVFFRNREL